MKSFLEQTFVTARPRLWLKSLKRDRLSSVCRVRSVTRVNSQINLLADGNSSQESVLQPQHKVTLTNVNAVAFITQRLPAINSEYDGQKRKIKLFFKRGLCLRLLWRMGHLSVFVQGRSLENASTVSQLASSPVITWFQLFTVQVDRWL